MQYYSVVIGRTLGVYLTWEMCNRAIHLYPGALYHKWDTLSDATVHLNKHGLEHAQITVYHTAAVILPLDLYCEANDLCVDVTADGNLHFHHYEKGITITPEQWFTLKSSDIEISQSFHKVKAGEPVRFSQCLCGDVFATMNAPYRVCNIRRWHNKHTPSRLEGVALREHQWRHLANIKTLLDHAIKNMSKDSKSECLICLSQPALVAFSTCGHVCTCLMCSKRLDTCPLCREVIDECIRVYF